MEAGSFIDVITRSIEEANSKIIPNAKTQLYVYEGYFYKRSESVLAITAIWRVFIRQNVRKGYHTFPNCILPLK